MLPFASAAMSFTVSSGIENPSRFPTKSSTVCICRSQRTGGGVTSAHRPFVVFLSRYSNANVQDARRTSSALGAATRMRRHRERIGAMSLLVLFAQRTRRMFDMYFSIVRRSAACASRESESASWITTTCVRAWTIPTMNEASGRGSRVRAWGGQGQGREDSR